MQNSSRKTCKRKKNMQKEKSMQKEKMLDREPAKEREKTILDSKNEPFFPLRTNIEGRLEVPLTILKSQY